jgi:TonB family protein
MRNRFAVALFVLLTVLSLFTISALAQDVTDANRKIVTKVVPQYPSLARAMRIQGNVRADVLVEPNGKVKSVEVKGGHPLLAQSAQDALRQWKWEPASRETHQTVELKFTP